MLDFAQLEQATAEEVLQWAISEFGDRLAITTSFQAAGMVIIDMAARLSSAPRIVTLDTGRLPEETYRMIEQVRSRYGLAVEVVFPDSREVENMVKRHGPNLFYNGVPLRTLCCHIRKVRPLERKLQEFGAWTVGLRRSQAATRELLPKVQEESGRIKVSPLADWTGEQVQNYLRANDVPVHPLYERGYTSIGCAPCTRATSLGEDERAGRWW
ncbi:MAG: phosphoadenylyl-sulfate reductase, partial [Bryobacteraceae bacterium]